ncbi:MAG TPA: MarP family serine protease [Acidimicrobiales bacterium]|nr:MarP family serine protease [Acidimicrobiales bacterium]
MNALDLAILGAIALAALGGYRLGLLARAASWVGMVAGLYLSFQLLPEVINLFNGPDASSKLGITLVVLIAGAFVGQAVGLLVGMRIHRFIPIGPLRLADKTGGALFAAGGVLIAVWALVLPSMSDVSGWPARQVRNSAIAHGLHDIAPQPPQTFKALRRLVGDNGFPSVFNALRPTPDPGPAPTNTLLTPATIARVTASTVKVEGEACRRIQEGSGFAVATDTIVTNAHVVAGVKSPRVLRPSDGRRLPATVVLYDADRDLAILKVRALAETPLALAEGKAGDQGAVFGHPNGQDRVQVAPAQVSQRVRAVGRDLYDAHTTRRDVFILAAVLRPGDSGGPLVNVSGSVIGVAFAIAPDKPDTAYALTTKEVQAALAAQSATPVATGSCLASA